jgi:hypothetical protein
MKLIIVTDLGLLRAYREVKGLQDHAPHLELVEELKPEAAREKFSDQVTDQAGRFSRGSGADITTGDLSAGERLNLDAEQTRRLLSRLARKIDTLLAEEAVTDCRLAASAPIHKQLLDALNPKARGKISQVLASNLAENDPKELLGHFAKAAAKNLDESNSA